MDRFTSILSTVVFFLFPIPFLLGFAMSEDGGWTVALAYAAIAVLVLAAVAIAVIATRRGGDG